jgi:hypothetical protein
MDFASGHVSDQQFYRVGADINDGAADGFHVPGSYKTPARKPNRKMLHFAGIAFGGRRIRFSV